MIRTAVLSVVVFVTLTEPSFAHDSAPSSRASGVASRSGEGATLGRCLQLAEQNHPNLLAERARLARTRAQLTEAHVAPFSQFRATGGFGIAPTVRGDGVFSPNTDQSLTSHVGTAWRFDVSGVVPLWTFGKITNLWDAAEGAVHVGEQQLQATRDDIRFDVRKAYYGLLLARDALELLSDAQSQLDEAAGKLEKEVDAEEGDPVDLLKLQTYLAELQARLSEAQKYEKVASAGLRFYTGAADLTVKQVSLDVATHRLGPLGVYLTAARVHRPEVLMAHAGLQAREAQVRLAQAQLFPDFGLGMSFGASYAPEVANQINPFVSDPGNYFRYGLGLVFQWNLDFPAAHARVLQAQAQLEEMVALDRKALGGVAAEVESAHADAVDWRKRLDAFNKSEKYARKWLITVQQSIDVGTSEEKELLDPARRWAELRYSRLNATMEYNLALAKLARVTGWDAIAPRGL